MRCLRARIWSLSIDPAYIKVHESANSWGETVDKAVGLIRGGLNTKLHARVDGLGKPVTFLLYAGNGHDSIHAIEQLDKLEISGSNVLADRAYGAKAIRDHVSERGASYVIPPQSSIAEP